MLNKALVAIVVVWNELNIFARHHRFLVFNQSKQRKQKIKVGCIKGVKSTLEAVKLLCLFNKTVTFVYKIHPC